MEKPKNVFPFPGPEQRARINAEKRKLSPETLPALDPAKLISVRGMLHKMRETHQFPYGLSEAALRELHQELSEMKKFEMIEKINDSSEELVRIRPTFYAALLNELDATDTEKDSKDPE